MLRLNLLLILAIVAIKKTDAVCGDCNSNGVACVSKNEFQVCIGNTPNTNQTYFCPNPKHICTKYGFICEDPNVADIKPACGDTSLCGVCTGVPNGGFACTSRTTMTMCRGETLSNQRGSCPQGYLCDPKNYNSPCVRTCLVDETAICDLATPIDEPERPATESTTPTEVTTPIATASEPITSTESIPTTTLEITASTSATITTTNPESGTQSPSATVCSQEQSSGRFPYLDNSDCGGYVNCFWKSGKLESNTLLCPEGRYFNRDTRSCATVKPVWCR